MGDTSSPISRIPVELLIDIFRYLTISPRIPRCLEHADYPQRHGYTHLMSMPPALQKRKSAWKCRFSPAESTFYILTTLRQVCTLWSIATKEAASLWSEIDFRYIHTVPFALQHIGDASIQILADFTPSYYCHALKTSSPYIPTHSQLLKLLSTSYHLKITDINISVPHALIIAFLADLASNNVPLPQLRSIRAARVDRTTLPNIYPVFKVRKIRIMQLDYPFLQTLTLDSMGTTFNFISVTPFRALREFNLVFYRGNETAEISHALGLVLSARPSVERVTIVGRDSVYAMDDDIVPDDNTPFRSSAVPQHEPLSRLQYLSVSNLDVEWTYKLLSQLSTRTSAQFHAIFYHLKDLVFLRSRLPMMTKSPYRLNGCREGFHSFSLEPLDPPNIHSSSLQVPSPTIVCERDCYPFTLSRLRGDYKIFKNMAITHLEVMPHAKYAHSFGNGPLLEDNVYPFSTVQSQETLSFVEWLGVFLSLPDLTSLLLRDIMGTEAPSWALPSALRGTDLRDCPCPHLTEIDLSILADDSFVSCIRDRTFSLQWLTDLVLSRLAKWGTKLEKLTIHISSSSLSSQELRDIMACNTVEMEIRGLRDAIPSVHLVFPLTDRV